VLQGKLSVGTPPQRVIWLDHCGGQPTGLVGEGWEGGDGCRQEVVLTLARCASTAHETRHLLCVRRCTSLAPSLVTVPSPGSGRGASHQRLLSANAGCVGAALAGCHCIGPVQHSPDVPRSRLCCLARLHARQPCNAAPYERRKQRSGHATRQATAAAISTHPRTHIQRRPSHKTLDGISVMCRDVTSVTALPWRTCARPRVRCPQHCCASNTPPTTLASGTHTLTHTRVLTHVPQLSTAPRHQRPWRPPARLSAPTAPTTSDPAPPPTRRPHPPPSVASTARTSAPAPRCALGCALVCVCGGGGGGGSSHARGSGGGGHGPAPPRPLVPLLNAQPHTALAQAACCCCCCCRVCFGACCGCVRVLRCVMWRVRWVHTPPAQPGLCTHPAVWHVCVLLSACTNAVRANARTPVCARLPQCTLRDTRTTWCALRAEPTLHTHTHTHTHVRRATPQGGAALQQRVERTHARRPRA
jgi:hypothetical protein